MRRITSLIVQAPTGVPASPTIRGGRVEARQPAPPKERQHAGSFRSEFRHHQAQKDGLGNLNAKGQRVFFGQSWVPSLTQLACS